MALNDKYPNLICLYSNIRSFKYLYTKIRDKTTNHLDFIKYSKRIMTIISEEGLSINQQDITITTPTNIEVNGSTIDISNVVAISIIRAGDSLLDSFTTIVPEALVGKILIQRNESTAEPMLYYSKFPNLINKKIYLLDPMLATGGSAIAAIKELISNGANIHNIVFLNVIACPEGLENIFKEFPDITIVTGCIDEGLNEKKYIIPGLGDYGDRFYGTN